MRNRTFISKDKSLQHDYVYSYSTGEFTLTITYPSGEEAVEEISKSKAVTQFSNLISNGMTEVGVSFK